MEQRVVAAIESGGVGVLRLRMHQVIQGQPEVGRGGADPAESRGGDESGPALAPERVYDELLPGSGGEDPALPRHGDGGGEGRGEGIHPGEQIGDALAHDIPAKELRSGGVGIDHRAAAGGAHRLRAETEQRREGGNRRVDGVHGGDHLRKKV